LSWARDYGLKRLKKVSPFILEALDLAKVPEDVLSTTALEDIKRYAPQESQPRVLSKVEEKAYLTLSFFQVDDYLTCPLKYKYRHILRIPVLPHHNLVFGRVMHNAVYYYLKSKVAGNKVTEKELLREYENLWVNEGYLSREHEEMRKKAGKKALRLFFRREEESKHVPQFLEKSFKWQSDSIKFIGRWDRIDHRKEGAVLIDFKATEVKDKKEADRKAKNSLQMDLYALSFSKTQEEALAETQLHFLESDIIGRALKGEKELQRAMDKIREAEQGIRSRDFKAKPDWHNCSHCEFKAICPASYAY
jgi:DNA helicase-2/ATP-dependent DNA helicase PcrA